MPWSRLSAGVVLALVASVQPPGADQLGGFLRRMAESLARMPNYTCTETIERWRPEPGGGWLDRLRLEVAVLNNHERFALPGARGFEDKDIDQMVTGPGTTVSGDFAGFARGVFVADHASFSYGGPAKMDHRRAVRFDYRVSPDHSGFRLGVGEVRKVVGYSGSFWIDAQAQDLLRLEVNAGPLPAELGLERATLTTDYARVRIGGAGFVLPQRTEVVLVHRGGRKNRNVTHYSGCRQYVGESSISFGDTGTPAAAPEAAVSPREAGAVAPELAIEATLDDSLSVDSCAVGDLITATVVKPARQDGAIAVPKGARLRGRVVRMERQLGPRPLTIIGLDFATLENDGTRLQFRARLRDVNGTFPGRSARFAVRLEGREAVLMVAGSQQSVPKGVRFYWETLPQP